MQWIEVSGRSPAPSMLIFLVLASTCGLHAQEALPAGRPIGRPPRLAGAALYLDTNRNALADAGDEIRFSFDRRVVVNGSAADAFACAVAGDQLGSGAALEPGPAEHQVTLILGAGALLRSRGLFAPGVLAAGSPSGLDVSPLLPDGLVVAANGGRDALPSSPVDLAPGFTGSGHQFPNNMRDSALRRRRWRPRLLAQAHRSRSRARARQRRRRQLHRSRDHARRERREPVPARGSRRGR